MNDIELAELFGDIYRKIMKRTHPIAKAEGLSMTEMIVLWKVHKRKSCRVTELAAVLGLSPSTLTGVLDRLTAALWLERGDDPEDRRAVVMRSTPKLDGFIRNTMKESSKDLAKVLKKLPPELVTRLTKDLSLVLGCLEEEEGVER